MLFIKESTIHLIKCIFGIFNLLFYLFRVISYKEGFYNTLMLLYLFILIIMYFLCFLCFLADIANFADLCNLCQIDDGYTKIFDPVRDAIESNAAAAAQNSSAQSSTGGPGPGGPESGGLGPNPAGVAGTHAAGSRTTTDEVADFSEANKGKMLRAAGIKETPGSRGQYNAEMSWKFKLVKSHHPEVFRDSVGHQLPINLKYVNKDFIDYIRSLHCNCPD